ncbi:MAG: hypothetical protein OEW68_04695 [Gammaproteobacteria bacterium]|nr:hypothetical protein [Gammaproteobacteria bacterium]MDH4314120.1 hypothetical protein [Gammaproteobacteria bacterium]MDH5213162.1 hypothetical protein [Gammaproteobacteria bacterium]
MTNPKTFKPIGTSIAIMVIAGCASVPLNHPKTMISALIDTDST